MSPSPLMWVLLAALVVVYAGGAVHYVDRFRRHDEPDEPPALTFLRAYLAWNLGLLWPVSVPAAWLWQRRGAR